MSDRPDLRVVAGEYRRPVDPLAVLERALAPEVVAAIDELIEQRAQDHAERALAHAQLTTAKPWLTVHEAAVMLGCSDVAVRARHKRGRLQGRYQGRRLYIASDSITHLSDYAAPANQTAPATRKRPGARTTKE